MASLSWRVYQKLNTNVEFSILLENKKSKESLLFQSGIISTIGQPETDSIRGDHYGRLLDTYGCLGVLQACPREHTQLYLVVVTRCVKISNLENSIICRIQEVDIISLQTMRPPNQKSQDEDPWIKELKKLLGNESFYFSVASGTNDKAFDLTLCAQRRAKGAPTDNKFFWNRMLHLHPKRFGVDTNKWMIKVMCGSIEFSTLYMNNHTPKIFIISRLSCERAGTRFNVRGVDDSGNVANFVETEQLVLVDSLSNLVLSYIQLRGTVPLFWEQPGLNVGSHKVKMSREPEVSVQSFRRHARFLREKYGKQVVLNLLGTGVTGKRQGETALSHLFQLQHLNCHWTKDSPHIVFDFHQECRGGTADALNNKLKPQISSEIEEFGFFCSKNGNIEKLQSGVMRTNCLDCLDRTNRVQSFLGVDVMHKYLEIMGVSTNGVIVQRFSAKFDELWKDNGNKISLNYAGTGALQGSKIIDGARSAARTIQNNLLDNSKQEAIDIMLHGNLLNNYLATFSRTLLPSNYLYAPLSVLREMCDRSPEYSESIPLRIAVGTYNVNGGKHFRSLAYKHLSLDDWLLDSQMNEGKSLLIDMSPSSDDIDVQAPDVFAIGFEEIVDLTAQNIVQNTQWSENANSWGRELQKVISRDEKYVMVTWKQLVGVALFVFVHEKHSAFVWDVSVETVKTGMQGTTGNKGGVGIRMVIRNTSIAFLCSHFAAGQKEVTERNNDYDSIVKKMIFNLGVPLWAHDYVFWCGDFNYRINLPRDEVMDLVKRQEWDMLHEHDQLLLSKNDGKCFKGFMEGHISFGPTYKYDLFSDDYDTSEKSRIPAWTDRVLFWRRQYDKDKSNPHWSPGKIVHYGRAELKQSDHRPVLAIFDIEGRIVVDSNRSKVYESMCQTLGPTDCSVIVSPTMEYKEFDASSHMEAVQDSMSDLGTVVLTRPKQGFLLVIFAASQTALKAASLSPMQIGEYSFKIELKTLNWRQHLKEELELCGDTTIPLVEETLNFTDQSDPEIPLERVEGVLKQLYMEENEDAPEMVTSEIIKPARPAPPRPAPFRPPPPRPTPPSSPATGIKVTNSENGAFEKPVRPASLFDDKMEPLKPLKTASSTSTPTPPAVPSRTPSIDSPASTKEEAKDGLMRAPSPKTLQNGEDSMEPPSPNHFRPISRDDDSFPPSPPLESPPVVPPTPSSMPPPGPPPSLPKRSPAHVPRGPAPPLPNRTLPPVPARNLPPLPPRK